MAMRLGSVWENCLFALPLVSSKAIGYLLSLWMALMTASCPSTSPLSSSTPRGQLPTLVLAHVEHLVPADFSLQDLAS